MANSVKWSFDGTFKSAVEFYYQHYIIHGDYKKKWPLPGCYAMLKGKSYENYKLMIDQLKEAAMAIHLELNPEVISLDFEKGAIKAFRLAFPNAKLQGCHFHFSNAVHTNIVKIGLSKQYKDNISKFRTWSRMAMCLPFLKIEDLDACWNELVDTKPDVPLINEFINYFNMTWMNVERAATNEDQAVANAHFSRDVWNFHDRSHEFRTNNTSETYNHKMNGHLEKAHPNIYRMLDLLQEEESRTTVSKNRCDQGTIKVRKTKHMLKDKDIEILKLKYDFGSIEPMEFLMQVEQFIKEFD